jgi:hypothetical protein
MTRFNGADGLVAEDFDGAVHTAAPAGHQPVQVRASHRREPGAEGDRGNDVGSGHDAGVEVHLDVPADLTNHLGEQVERDGRLVELASTVVGQRNLEARRVRPSSRAAMTGPIPSTVVNRLPCSATVSLICVVRSSATTEFARLEMGLWTTRVRAELRAVGERDETLPVESEGTLQGGGLTAQQLQIARLIAEGGDQP